MLETTPLRLRDVIDSDLDRFFEYECDPQANHMAAFTAKNPDDRAAFDAHWARIRANTGVHIQTILFGEEVTGSVLSYEDSGHTEVSYWIGRRYWGKGIATRAVQAFLQVQTNRPIYARAAKDNLASMRVLRKCGFRIIEESTGFANARGKEIEEVVMALE
jgi:RimJ/RimL family protein N-acetyltransferase